MLARLTVAQYDEFYGPDEKLPPQVYRYYTLAERDEFFVVAKGGTRIVIESKHWRHVWHWRIGNKLLGIAPWYMYAEHMRDIDRWARSLTVDGAGGAAVARYNTYPPVKRCYTLTAASAARVKHLLYGPAVLRGFCYGTIETSLNGEEHAALNCRQ